MDSSKVFMIAAMVAAMGCSSATESGPGVCEGDAKSDLSGNYKTTLLRSGKDPGTCPSTYVYDGSVYFTVGSASYPPIPPWTLAESTGMGSICIMDKAECQTIVGTCPSSYGEIDKVSLTITGSGMRGTVARTTSTGCSANFDLLGQKF